MRALRGGGSGPAQCRVGTVTGESCAEVLIRIQLFRVLCVLALAAAAVGVVLPGVPTVPFLLVAAWGGSKGWPALEERLLAHPRYGPPIRDWRERRAIPLSGKLGASAMMVASRGVTWIATRDPLPVSVLAAALSVVAAWLWTRPGR